MFTKNQQLLAYLAKNHLKASITVLMKLSYIIDLFFVKSTGRKLSNFNYVRYYHGPYDSSINSDIQVLVDSQIIYPKAHYTATGEEFIVYNFNDGAEFDFNDLSQPELEKIDEIMETLKGYGAKTLTDIAYKTKPMLALGATHGGNEHLNTVLDLSLR